MDDLKPFEADIVCNVSEETIDQNIRYALTLPHEVLANQYNTAQTLELCIIGGGPSLKDNLHEIKLKSENGSIIWALNNTFKYLVEHGIYPHAHIMMDARPENAEFVPENTQALMLYASQCHKSVFEKVSDKKVIVWHRYVDGILELLDEYNVKAVIIGSGTTVGMNAFGLAQVFGFKEIHLYGYDSSYRNDDNHAYQQPLNNGENIDEITVNGRKFRCAAWMVVQVEEFKQRINDFLSQGMAFYVHGDGLLPYTAELIMQPPDISKPLRVNYSLRHCPASWNFIEWMFNMEMHRQKVGYPSLEVHFMAGPDNGFRKNEPVAIRTEEKQRMFEGICKASLPLFGAIESPDYGVDLHMPYTSKPAVESFKAGQTLPKLKLSDGTTEWAKKYKNVITITLREADHWPERNSNLGAWIDWADEQKDAVIFIRDTAKAHELIDGYHTCPEASLDIEKRLALYRVAKMNMFVSNGPSILAIYDQTIPYLCFIKTPETYIVNRPEWYLQHVGIKLGDQWPWATDKQRMVLAEDTLDNIRQQYSLLNLQ